MKWLLIGALALLTGCHSGPDLPVWCPNPCLTNPHNLPLGPGWAASYTAARDKIEPGYAARMRELESDPGYRASMRSLDREMARTGEILETERFHQDMDMLRRQAKDLSIDYYRHR